MGPLPLLRSTIRLYDRCVKSQTKLLASLKGMFPMSAVLDEEGLCLLIDYVERNK